MIFANHLKPRFGKMRLDKINVAEVAKFRAELVAKKLSDKRINNMAVLSKPLKYAADCEVIGRSPRIGMFKIERPEVVAWDFAQYARLLASAARMCRNAGLPVRYWHTLRHSFGTHAALFGVNPWRLQTWLGHKRIDETMTYVHVAENHRRDIPEPILEAAETERDPDRRIMLMLGARGSRTDQ